MPVRATAAIAILCAIFTYAIWSHGSIMYEQGSEIAQLRHEQRTLINSITHEQRDGRACATYLGNLIGDTEKYAITRQELRKCRRGDK